MTTEMCNENMQLGDDQGDNHTTFHCQLAKGHEGKHCENGVAWKDRSNFDTPIDLSSDNIDVVYTLTWENSK